jgi:hypothetical protein
MLLHDDSNYEERTKLFDCAQFVHEGRESNREAHMLAKLACSLGDGRHVWLGSPPVFLNVNIVMNHE